MMSAGSRIVNYEVLELIGSGSQGLVYLCRHTRLDRVDAVKVLLARLAENPGARARFEREAANAARLQHVNIATIHDAGETPDGFLYVAMRYIAGPDVAQLIRTSRMGSPMRVVNLLEGVADALDSAHAVGLIHRDVKPSNILVEHEGRDDERAVLVDFGIAKWWYELRSTGTSTAMGTYAYLAPERCVGHPGDDRSDQYSLGCATFECLTGKPPFPNHSPAQIVRAHLEMPPPSASAVRPELPAAVDDVLARAMAKNPIDRYPTCGAFASALRDALDPPTPRMPAAAPAPTRLAALLTPPRSVVEATSLTITASRPAVAVEEPTLVLGRPAPAAQPTFPYVRREVSVLSMLALAAVVGAYAVVVGSHGRAVAAALVPLSSGLLLAVLARRRARRRNQRGKSLPLVVALLTVALGVVLVAAYRQSSVDFMHTVTVHVRDLVSQVSGSHHP